MSFEEQYEKMLAEWTALASQGSDRVAHWNVALGRILEEETALRERGQWVRGRDDLLGVLGRQRDEELHSRVIAWLLDPCAPHGFGAEILRRFLETAFGLDSDEARLPNLGRARTRCEVAAGRGRIDVVVEAPGLYLVLENKVDAAEGDRQCDYYFDAVRRSDARFVLLTPDGRGTRSARAEVRAAWRSVRYAALHDLLEQAMTSRPAHDPGRALVATYARTLKKEFR